ncbi:MAG: adenosylhomocysteinase [Candidatus Nezhaarchaeota archaeon]|nr:adenosylhomocysteinase [Candidatus Nezhaarchaeota archaeon]MCX8141702.1 adenosylhomocysteinase [Candidatus Nezhaarchaeota archaeon]MDW8049969.1 adenosylhomocysteinase [Nitrososphaerota archaeon]
MDYKVKDVTLASKGGNLVRWARDHMPVLAEVRKRFSQEKPLENIVVGACLHVTKETAVLIETLLEGGAKVALCASNPLSTQDEVAAYLASIGVNVYAWRGMNFDEYYEAIGKVISKSPYITIDDGADLVSTVHKLRYGERSRDIEIVKKVLGETPKINIVGGTEETTTGVIRLRVLAREGKLLYPIIAVNDAYTKFLFDNRYGTGQSTIDGILRATNVLLAGKVVVVAGYGWCGRGIAMRARGMGAHVIITEVNPLRALEAVMDGFTVMPMNEACKIGDVFITATGNINVIRGEHMLKMKSGAILANSGHFNVEINLDDLEAITKEKREIRQSVVEHVLINDKKVYLLAEGRLVNLVAAEGHPSEVMDMSFANQALSVEYLVKRGKELKPSVHPVPKEIDEEVAKLKLRSMGISIDELTEEQRKYLESWEMGT